MYGKENLKNPCLNKHEKKKKKEKKGGRRREHDTTCRVLHIE